ncbi:toprim domain-containing protein [Calidifontibacter terrae]
MSHMHEEMEMGRELDQVLRTGIMGLAQIIEAFQRQSARRDRSATQDVTRALEQLQRRPQEDPGPIEKGQEVATAQRWISAAREAAENPTNHEAVTSAAIAAEQLRRRGTDPVAQLTDLLVDRAADRSDSMGRRDAHTDVYPATYEPAANRDQVPLAVLLPAGDDNPHRGIDPFAARTIPEHEHRVRAWSVAAREFQVSQVAGRFADLPQSEQEQLVWAAYDGEEARIVRVRDDPDVDLTQLPAGSITLPKDPDNPSVALGPEGTYALTEKHGYLRVGGPDGAGRDEGTHTQQMVIAAGNANPDRGMAPSKARTPEEAQHRRQAWAAARATHGEGLDPAAADKAWTALPQREQWDRFWKEYDTEDVRTVTTTGHGADLPVDEAAAKRAGADNNSTTQKPVSSVAAERGMAPSKAPTAEEAEHRRLAWAAAQQEFATTLPEGTSRADARKAWDGLDWQDKGLLYWKAYDEPGTQLAAPAAGNVAPAITRDRVLELNEQAAQWFTANAGPGSQGREYLESRLGVGLVEEGRWQVGYAPPGWTNLTGELRRGGASNEEIVAAGLGVRSSRGNVIDAFRDRAMIGIRDEAGATVGFVGRDLSGDPRAPKYTNTTATPAFSKGHHLLGLHEAPAGADLVRVEGPFDAIAVTQAGEGRVAGVAALGTVLTDHQAQLLVDHVGQRNVLLGLDNDAGGRSATEEDYWRLNDRGVAPRLLVLPPGQDPAQLWTEQPDTLRALLATSPVAPSAALVVVERTVEELQDGLREGRPEAREELAAAQDQLAATVPDVDRDQVRAYGQQLVDQLRDQTDDARLDAGAFDNRELEADSDTDRDQESPAQTDRDQDRAQDAHAQARNSDAAVDRFTAAAQDAAAATQDTPGPQLPAAYDRATETAIGQVPGEAQKSRIVSSYGYTRSTSSMLTDAAGTGTAHQAKKATAPQSPSRNRNRTK